MRFSAVPFFSLCLLSIVTSPVPAGERWLDDTCIADTCSGMDRVFLDVKEDNSVLYALVSGNQRLDPLGWYRSADGGLTWDCFFFGTWMIDDTFIGGAYGFDVVLYVCQTYGPMYEVVIDPITGALLYVGEFVDELPLIARDIAVDSNAETIPGGNRLFVVCATLIDPNTGQVTLKAYRSADLGSTWTNPTVLDQGPIGDPDYIGDMNLSFSVAGFPYFHVVYEKSGRLWHVRTADAGVSWGEPTELIVNVNPAGAVSVTSFGVYAIAVGESPTGQVVYCNSADAGASWSNAKLIDGGEGVLRLPSVSRRGGLCHVVYRMADGRLAERHTSNPDDPADWSTEVIASCGTTDRQPCVREIGGGNAGAVYARLDDASRPYYVSRSGVPSGVDHGLPPAGAGGIAAFPSPSSGPVTVVVPLGHGSRRAAAGDLGIVTDVAGRLVRTLQASAIDGPNLVSRWDGRDAGGKDVPPGVYYVRHATPAGVRSVPVLIVR